MGLIAISPDDISQRDLADFLSDTSVALVSTRVIARGAFPDQFCDVGAAVTEATKTLAPGMSLDAVVFGCTSCSLALGLDVIRSWIEKERPGVPVMIRSLRLWRNLGFVVSGRLASSLPIQRRRTICSNR